MFSRCQNYLLPVHVNMADLERSVVSHYDMSVVTQVRIRLLSFFFSCLSYLDKKVYQ